MTPESLSKTIQKPVDLHHQFLNAYMEYTADTESPNTFHRWTIMSVISGLVGRNCWLKAFGGVQYPNQYILLVGDPGARKGSAISRGKKLLKEIGFEKFAPDKVAKEALWHVMAEMAGQTVKENWEKEKGKEKKGGTMKDENIFDLDIDMDIDMQSTEEKDIKNTVAQMYICQDEFTAFTGHGNAELIDSLTNLWDNLDSFYNPKLTARDVKMYNPTLNILSGSTPENVATALPPQVIGSGFLSRMLMIYGEQEKSIAWPSPACKKLKQTLLEGLIQIEAMKGEMAVSEEVIGHIKSCYAPGKLIVNDARLASYSPRRHVHLIKLCMICALSRRSMLIGVQDFTLANTMLYLAEKRMHLSLGHFGRSKNSASASTVLGTIYRAKRPLTFRELWLRVSTDFGKQEELKQVLQNLKSSNKVQEVVVSTGGKRRAKCYAPMREVKELSKFEKFVDQSLLTPEERIM